MSRRTAVLAVVAVLLLAACGGGTKNASAVDQSGKVSGVVFEPGASRGHTQGTVVYGGKKPPSGGDHNPYPVTCGAYSQPVPDEYAVHSIEHGAVWIAYLPTLDAASITKLRALATQEKLLVTPYDGLATPIVLVAWQYRLELQSADDPRIQQFIDAYGNGKVAPEPNAACTGVGIPDQL